MAALGSELDSMKWAAEPLGEKLPSGDAESLRQRRWQRLSVEQVLMWSSKVE
jgi:hypothetical protein